MQNSTEMPMVDEDTFENIGELVVSVQNHVSGGNLRMTVTNDLQQRKYLSMLGSKPSAHRSLKHVKSSRNNPRAYDIKRRRSSGDEDYM